MLFKEAVLKVEIHLPLSYAKEIIEDRRVLCLKLLALRFSALA
jgi:hypothetical protein